MTEEASTVILLSTVLFLLTFFFSWVQFNTSLDALNTKLNIDNLTPADYTVMLSGVPVNDMTEEEIIRTFEVHVDSTLRAVGSSSVPVKIQKIISTYDLTPYAEKIDLLRALKKKKAAIDSYRTAYKKRGEKMGNTVTEAELKEIFPELHKGTDYEELGRQIDSLEKALNEYNKLDATQIRKLDKVFVTFTHTLSDDVLKAYFIGPLRYICGWSRYKMNGHSVMVLEAPEPEDVKWENLGYSFFSRTCRVIMNWLITAVILGVCLIANIFVSQKNKEYSKDMDNKALVTGLNLIFSTITCFINMVLAYVIPILTQYERLGTSTGYDASVAFKLSFSLFINSAIIPIITYQKENYFTEAGFLMSVWLNWLCICFVTPLFEIFDVWYWIYQCRWSNIRKEGVNSLYTQQEANIALEPYEVSMTYKFAQAISIMFYTAFYVIIFPPGIIITIAGLIFQYWLSKVRFSFDCGEPKHPIKISI